MRIVSGGQTGVDRAALDAALFLALPCGGWCPRGRRAEDGVIDAVYPLDETPDEDYAQRTEWNVRDSDATLILTEGDPTGGTALTIALARQWRRPIYIADLEVETGIETALAWLRKERVGTLNVAGPRESTLPGIYGRARQYLDKLFGAMP
ncbi:MAG: molybdenum cofactor carrier [Candidatus Hydrogenedens sp.]|nr:molybdenum cofactor carrier [Candidatus Hydrogenedens sp.]